MFFTSNNYTKQVNTNFKKNEKNFCICLSTIQCYFECQCPYAFIVFGKVIVFNDTVKNPDAVHYNWADDANDGNLYITEEFPASPFRTDNWEMITSNGKYDFTK